mgnify:CR=1 FL=1
MSEFWETTVQFEIDNGNGKIKKTKEIEGVLIKPSFGPGFEISTFFITRTSGPPNFSICADFIIYFTKVPL